jgi:hypothetical protein
MVVTLTMERKQVVRRVAATLCNATNGIKRPNIFLCAQQQGWLAGMVALTLCQAAGLSLADHLSAGQCHCQ